MEEWDDSYAYYHYQRPARGGSGWITGGLIVDFIITCLLATIIVYFLFHYVLQNYRQYVAFNAMGSAAGEGNGIPPPGLPVPSRGGLSARVGQSAFVGGAQDVGSHTGRLSVNGGLGGETALEIQRLRRELDEKDALLKRQQQQQQQQGQFYQGNSFFGFGNGSPPRTAAARALFAQAFPSGQQPSLAEPQQQQLFPQQPLFGGGPAPTSTFTGFPQQTQPTNPAVAAPLFPSQQPGMTGGFSQQQQQVMPRMSVFADPSGGHGFGAATAGTAQGFGVFSQPNGHAFAAAPSSNAFSGAFPQQQQQQQSTPFAPTSGFALGTPQPFAGACTNQADLNRQFMDNACGGDQVTRATTMMFGDTQPGEPGPHLSPGGFQPNAFNNGSAAAGRRSGAAGRMDSPVGAGRMGGFERPQAQQGAGEVHARGGVAMTFDVSGPKSSRPPLGTGSQRTNMIAANRNQRFATQRVSEVAARGTVNPAPSRGVCNFDEVPVGGGGGGRFPF